MNANEPEQTLVGRMVREHGPLLSGETLRRLAGFPTADSFRMAANRGALGFEIFPVEGRRGRFARTEDVAAWLTSLNIRHF